MNEIDRLNSYSKIPDAAMVNLMINKLSGPLHLTIALFECLRLRHIDRRAQLVRMYIINTNLQYRDTHTRQRHNDQQTKKHTFAHLIQLKGGLVEEKKYSGNKRDFTPQDQRDRSNQESHCFKCGRKTYEASACE